MNGREVSDTKPLADLFHNKVEHFVYMSSAGVYKKSLVMPHIEVPTPIYMSFIYMYIFDCGIAK